MTLLTALERLGRSLAATSPWVWLALGGLATTELVHASRGWATPAGVAGLLQGTLPNASAVFSIAFMLMCVRYSSRKDLVSEPVALGQADRWFGVSLAVAGAGLVAWEFAQLTGRLVFDPLDLVATFAGMLLAGLAYLAFRPRPGRTG